jgi:threonine aldolase
MLSIHRRTFLAMPLAVATLETAGAASEPPQSTTIVLTGDGLGLSPVEYARLLTTIAGEGSFRRDTYLAGGPVEELEKRVAALLGKERAIFLPTGTLANHMAVRLLAGERRKVLVQEESHLYRDEGDCAPLLSGLNLVPLAPGRTTFTAAEVAQAVEQAAGPPYPAPVGAISIESPVRRTMGQVFDFDEMKKICAYAKSKQIGTHLDGARMFLASAYTGIPPAQYAALFDSVYVSMYKYFNAPFGAILTGPASLIEKAGPLRHQFGSMIYQGWETASVALHFLDGFSDRYQAAVRNGERLFQLLEAGGKIRIERVPSGSNIARLRLASGGTLDSLRERLAKAGIVMGGARNGADVPIMINETINRRSPEEIAQAFAEALA